MTRIAETERDQIDVVPAVQHMEGDREAIDLGYHKVQTGASDGDQSALLPLLHSLQHDIGFVPQAAVPALADLLNLSRAEVHGVISFYPDFRGVPTGRHLVKICRAEACKARGSDAIERIASELFDVAMGGTRADGAVTLEPIYCLGMCAVGPNALIDGVPMARLDESKVSRLAEQLV